MTVSTGAYLQNHYNQIKALGDKAVSSDAQFVIAGFEQMRLLCKQFPWPVLSPGGEIAVAGPLGTESWQPQQVKFNLQGQVTFYETVRGDMDGFMRDVLLRGARFDATVYEGTMEKYHRGCKIRDCFLQFDPPDRDWENRTQILTVSGTLFYHYFSETIPGNIAPNAIL